MSTFPSRIPVLQPKIPHPTEGDEIADSPAIHACTFSLRWRDPSPCITRHHVPVPSTGLAGAETDDLKSLLPAPGDIPKYDAEDRDYMIRTIAFEAADEPDEGKAAVAYVILNRLKSGWGDKIKDVVTRPGQFEPWMTKRDKM